MNTNKAAVSNLFLSSYFARFAADPYKERSTKNQNAKTNNSKADKKRAGDQAIATLAGNPLPPQTNIAAEGNFQPHVNAENGEQAAQDFVAAAGAAAAETQGPREPQAPIFARPQGINMASDGWIDYTENNFEALYRMHEAQLEAYNAEVKAYHEQKNAAATESYSDFEDDNDDLIDGDNFIHEDDNGNTPNGQNDGVDYSDIFDDIYGVSDDETRERRRQEASAARAPAALPNMPLNGSGSGPTMSSLAMPIFAARPTLTQPSSAARTHASSGLMQPTPPGTRIQQVAHRPFAVPAVPNSSPQEGLQFPARPGPGIRRPGPDHVRQPVQFQSSPPMAQVQSPARPLPNVVPRRIITPASERARLLRESQQPAVMSIPPPAIHNAPPQQAAKPQAAPVAPQLQPSHGRLDSSAGPAS